jgi:hypothetical protein
MVFRSSILRVIIVAVAGLSLSGCQNTPKFTINGVPYETVDEYLEKRRQDHQRARQDVRPLDRPIADKAILVIPTDEAIWGHVSRNIDGSFPAGSETNSTFKELSFLLYTLDFEAWREHMEFSNRFHELKVERADHMSGIAIPENSVVMWVELSGVDFQSHIAAHGDRETRPFTSRFLDGPETMPLKRYYAELDGFLLDRLHGL